MLGWTWKDNFTDNFKTNGEVSYWKVAAAVAASVVSPEVAVVYGVKKAAQSASDYVTDREKQAERRGEQRGEAKAKAEYAHRSDKAVELLKAELAKRYEDGRYFKLVVALTAIGMACAACDGDVAAEELANIREFVGGASVTALPEHVRKQLDLLTKTPPNLATAFELVKQYEPDSMEVFDQLIRLVIISDGHCAEEELQFQAEWERLKKAA